MAHGQNHVVTITTVIAAPEAVGERSLGEGWEGEEEEENEGRRTKDEGRKM